MSADGNGREPGVTINEGKVYRIVLCFDTVTERMAWDIQDMPVVVAVGMLAQALTLVKRADAEREMAERMRNVPRIALPGMGR